MRLSGHNGQHQVLLNLTGSMLLSSIRNGSKLKRRPPNFKKHASSVLFSLPLVIKTDFRALQSILHFGLKPAVLRTLSERPVKEFRPFVTKWVGWKDADSASLGEDKTTTSLGYHLRSQTRRKQHRESADANDAEFGHG